MSEKKIDTSVDGHVHTRLCHHAQGEMEEYVRSAIAKGLRKIVFLEHLELGVDYFESTWLSEEDFDYYFTEGKRLARKYAGSIEVGLGVEVGYNPAYKEDIRCFLAERSWDRIGISYHFLSVAGLVANMVSRKKENIDAMDRIGPAIVLESYYHNLLEAVNYLPGTVLCHLDAALRHHPDYRDLDGRVDLVWPLLDAVKEKGMAIEVNTSGFGLRGEPFPGRYLLQEVIQRGIPLVAGSDAHHPDQVGRHFEQLSDYMARL